jgi:HEAT repeat protein
VSEPAAIGQLLQSIDESPDGASDAYVGELLMELRPAALATLLGWLPRMSRASVIPRLEAAVDRLASHHTAELVRALDAADRVVVEQAMRRAGALRTAAAVPALARLAGDADPAFRLHAVQALGEIASAGALQALERAVDDGSRDVRIAAARALGARAFKPALGRLEQAVRGRAVRDADLTEKVALFEAYGALCGDGGVPLLDGLLNGRSLLGRREDPELRACAALALGRVATAAARAALERAAGEREVLVRNAVNRAMRGPAA